MIESSGFDTLPASYEEGIQDYLAFYARITISVTILLILAGILLDYLFYPEKLIEFLGLRIAASLTIAVALWLIENKISKNGLKTATLAWALVPQIMINYMISQTGGDQSIYFVGLTYALAGLGVFFPLALVEASGFAGVTLLMYAAACYFGAPDRFPTKEFFGNVIFLSFFAVVMVVVSIYGEKWRRQTYSLQKEARDKGRELNRANKTLTETKLQLVQSEKMASLGTLSAGLIHELNNPINYSAIAVKLADGYLAEGDIESAKEVTKDAAAGIERIKAITSDLKTFAYQRDDTESPLSASFNLLEAVRVAGRLTAHERLGLTFDVRVPEAIWVRGDAAGISSVFINLLSNASSAVERAKRGTSGRISITATPYVDDEFVEVSVFDNGAGIEPEHIKRVFEPFFTTRTVGEGLGMGLSISYAIVKRHGSALQVKSLPGEYTEFSFSLPLDRERSEERIG